MQANPAQPSISNMHLGTGLFSPSSGPGGAHPSLPPHPGHHNLGYPPPPSSLRQPHTAGLSSPPQQGMQSYFNSPVSPPRGGAFNNRVRGLPERGGGPAPGYGAFSPPPPPPGQLADFYPSSSAHSPFAHPGQQQGPPVFQPTTAAQLQALHASFLSPPPSSSGNSMVSSPSPSAALGAPISTSRNARGWERVPRPAGGPSSSQGASTEGEQFPSLGTGAFGGGAPGARWGRSGRPEGR